MVFAKVLLIIAIAAVIVLSLVFRARAALRARKARWVAEQAAIERELGGGR